MATLWLDGQGTLFAPVAARRQKVFKRGKHSSFCPFRSFRTSEKNSEREVSLCLSTAAASPTPVSATPTAFASQIGQFPYLRAKVPSTVKTKDLCLSAFSFAYAGAKEKAIKKKTPKEDFALCGALTQSRRRRHTRSAYVSIPTAVGGRRRLLKKAGENFNDGA